MFDCTVTSVTFARMLMSMSFGHTVAWPHCDVRAVDGVCMMLHNETLMYRCPHFTAAGLSDTWFVVSYKSALCMVEAEGDAICEVQRANTSRIDLR